MAVQRSVAPTGMTGLTALTMAALASACVAPPDGRDAVATATRSQALIGGQQSDPNEFLATGMIVAANQQICTATLIAPDVVLTAAHCLTPPVYGRLGFTLDADEGDGIDEPIDGAVIHQHPDFDDRVDAFLDLAVRNDVGVMILARPITDVMPEQIDSPSLDLALDPGSELAVCGYGRHEAHTIDAARKRDAMVTVDRTTTFEFSTMPEGPQPCSGDSGAPLFASGPDGRRLVGLVSRAVGRSSMCDTGAIITRVNQYSSWITKASRDRDAGCSAGGSGSSVVPLVALALQFVRRRRRAR